MQLPAFYESNSTIQCNGQNSTMWRPKTGLSIKTKHVVWRRRIIDTLLQLVCMNSDKWVFPSSGKNWTVRELLLLYVISKSPDLLVLLTSGNSQRLHLTASPAQDTCRNLWVRLITSIQAPWRHINHIPLRFSFSFFTLFEQCTHNFD